MKKNLHPLLGIILGSLSMILPSTLFASSCCEAHEKDHELDDYRWTSLHPTGECKGRHENGFVEYKGKFYLIGGRGINPVNVYDPASNSWETKSKSPMEIHHFQAVVVDDAIYLMGAMTGPYPKETPIEHIWIYYPETDSWEKGDVIPENRRRGGAGASLYNGKIYMVCGIELGHTSGTNNYFDSYDLATGEWKVLTKAPHVRDHFSSIIVDDKLYCIGGRNTSVHHAGDFGAFFRATVSAVDVYDFNEGEWITLKQPLPYPTAAGGIVNVEDYILYMGGEGSLKQAYNHTQCMNTKTGDWVQLAPMTTGRHGTGAVLHKGNIFIAAGSPIRGGGNMNTIEVFSATHDWESLFNGKDLSGWEVKALEKDADREFWSVENGAILSDSMGSTDHAYNWLQHEKAYEDFEFRLKFQVAREHKGNTGVQFRSKYDDKAVAFKDNVGWMDGPQADINPEDPFRNGLIYDETRSEKRWIFPSMPSWNISTEDYDYNPKRVFFYWEDEETGWNDMTIICNGTHVTTYVNNMLISEYDGAGLLDDDEHLKLGVGMKGHIALQLHGHSENKISFKDIEIRPLK